MHSLTFTTERNLSRRLMANEKVSVLNPKNLDRESRSLTSSSLSLVVILRPLSWDVSMSLKPLNFGWYRPSQSVRALSWTAKGNAPGPVTVSIICVAGETEKFRPTAQYALTMSLSLSLTHIYLYMRIYKGSKTRLCLVNTERKALRPPSQHWPTRPTLLLDFITNRTRSVKKKWLLFTLKLTVCLWLCIQWRRLNRVHNIRQKMLIFATPILFCTAVSWNVGSSPNIQVIKWQASPPTAVIELDLTGFNRVTHWVTLRFVHNYGSVKIKTEAVHKKLKNTTHFSTLKTPGTGYPLF